MENAKESAKKGLNEVKSFYKGDFKEIIINFFKRPTDGMLSVFQKPSEKSLIHSAIIAVTVFLLFFIGSYLMAGSNFRKFMGFMSFVKIGLLPVLSMFIIACLSFVIKAVLGKANFKNELLTGAICGIPFILIFIVMILVQIFSGNNALTILANPGNAGTVGIIVIIYAFLMLINVVQQSLKSAKVQDALGWYLSPISVALSIYLASQILM